MGTWRPTRSKWFYTRSTVSHRQVGVRKLLSLLPQYPVVYFKRPCSLMHWTRQRWGLINACWQKVNFRLRLCNLSGLFPEEGVFLSLPDPVTSSCFFSRIQPFVACLGALQLRGSHLNVLAQLPSCTPTLRVKTHTADVNADNGQHSHGQ